MEKNQSTNGMNKISFKDKKARLILSSLLILYILLRVISWSNATKLEDSDSLREIFLTKMWLDHNFDKLFDQATSTIVYSFFSAICSLPGWSPEIGARLCTFLFSILLFFTLIGIAKRFTNFQSLVFGLLILNFDPFLIPFSFSVLTEPSYIAIVYLGFWLFWTQFQKPSLTKSLLLGLIFGLSFVNRTEGIVFLVAIPLMQFIHFIFFSNSTYNFKRMLTCISIFILGFALLAVPQIWNVSSKMGVFALNGRQVWQKVLLNPDGKSYDQKLYGLDYSPKITNIAYLQSHSSEYQISSSEGIEIYVKNIFREFTDLYYFRLGAFFGAFGLILFGLGLFSLFHMQKYYELILIILFFFFILFIPLLYHPWARNLAIIIPLFLLIEGVGAGFVGENFGKVISSYKWINFFMKNFSILIVILLILFSLKPLTNSIRTPTINNEYNPADLKETIAAIKSDISKNNLKDIKVSERKAYFAYLAGVNHIVIPFAEYDKLIKYCKLNNVDYIFLEYHLLREYPFIKKFIDKDIPEFTLIYKRESSFGDMIELYRINKSLKD